MKKEAVNPMREDNAISFMMFAYFGIANADNSLDVIKASINRAYRDAANHVLRFINEDDKKSGKEKAEKKINAAINQLQKCQVNYDEWHKKLCEGLIAIFKGYEYKPGYDFTYGIAQKWVNMTIKYLYIIYFLYQACGYEDKVFQLEYGQMMFKYVPDFHVPIDRAIIKAAKTDFNISPNFTSWCKIDNYEDYYNFEKAIKEHNSFDHDTWSAIRYSPIDWECPAWIDSITDS